MNSWTYDSESRNDQSKKSRILLYYIPIRGAFYRVLFLSWFFTGYPLAPAQTANLKTVRLWNRRRLHRQCINECAGSHTNDLNHLLLLVWFFGWLVERSAQSDNYKCLIQLMFQHFIRNSGYWNFERILVKSDNWINR